MSLISAYAFRLDPTTNKHICSATLIDEETTRNTLRLDGPCIYCKQPQSITVPAAALIEFGKGQPVQKCFPSLTAGEREFLLSGICDACWNKMFSDNETDTDEEV